MQETVNDNESFEIEFNDNNTRGSRKKNKVSFFKLFRFADTADIFMVLFGVVGSLVNGVSFPLNLLIFSDLVTGFTEGNALESMQRNLKWYMILGGGTLFIAFVQMFCFSLSAKRQGRRIRLLLFKRILRQDVAWYDEQSLGDLIAKLTASVEQIESGIGDRLGRFLQYFVMFISCFANAFSNEWRLALVGLSTTPVIVFAFTLMGIALSKFALKETEAYSSANTIAGEVLTSIRTVFAFVGQDKEFERYESKLGAAARVSVKKNLILGVGIGLIGFSIFGSAGLTFWYGIKLLEDGEPINPGTVTSVVLSFLVGSISLGLVLPEISYFARAKSAADGVFKIIDRVPEIDKDESGVVLDRLDGHIEFLNVSFAYPMRPDVTALKHFSLDIHPGQTIAIVGPSGSGKSTSVQLIQRFYDAKEGEILIDGTNIRDFDLKWLRNQIGVVSQEPVLFSGTVRENISLGREDASMTEIEVAAKMADAHEFIVSLPQAYDTPIAEGGGGMSGGQKQRIAIARAILRNPRILLLDEATSALDTRSERAVQQALDRARTGRTVIMIAHRLTTVRDADKILVVDRGEVKEMGTHDELVALQGMYANMLSTQNKVAEEDKIHSGSDQETESEDEKVMFTKDELRKRNVWLRSKSWKDKESEASSVSDTSSIVGKREKHPILRAVKMNKPEFPLFFLGLFIAFIGGLAQPGFSLLYSQMFQIFSLRPGDPAKMNNTIIIAAMMALLGFLRLVTQILGSLFLGFAGARLTKRTRSLLFKSILNQETGWFDKVENQPGILTARLATEVSSLETVTGAQLGSLLEAICLVISSLAIAFVYSWQLSLVNLCFMPVIVLASSLQMKHLKSSIGSHEVQGSQVVQEALAAERTVFSFGLEEHFYEKFRTKSAPLPDARYKEALMYALVHSLASSMTYFQTAASFYTGAVLMEQGELELLAVFRTYSAFNFGAQALSRVAAIAPDFKKAIFQIKSVFETIDRQTKLDVTEGDYPNEPFSGKIEFRNVYFRYPTRKNVRILKRFNHYVNPGESVALVGSSGCGKSTLLQLVQRLYDVNDHGADSGIFMDNKDIRDLAPNWIRQQIGIVSQEPNLFDLSIRENIAYGDNTREVSMDEIIAAAKDANAHEFVVGLPEGYETLVGARGSQLSGGQKQRVAIARALVRQPRLLLLDEATSALDNKSERIVQAALERAMKDGSRTSLVVAHRLTTVENCDYIVVLQEGSKVESGPPTELMKTKGVYYTLHNVDSAVQPH